MHPTSVISLPGHHRAALLLCLRALLTALLLSTVVTGADNQRPPVALLAAEVHVEEGTAGQVAALVDVALLKSLEQHDGFRLIDRQAIEVLLRERELMLAAGQAAAPLRPMLAAGIVICPEVTPVRTGDAAAAVVIDAISADTGNLLASRTLALARHRDQWQPAGTWQPQIAALWQEASAELQRQRSGLLFVDRVALKSDEMRLQWRADQLTDALRAAASSFRHIALLTPRHPLAMREERVLRAMGLIRDDEQWTSPAAAATWRLETELVEDVRPNQPSDRAPVHITLVLRSQTDELARAQLSGTAGTMDTLLAEAVAWAQRHITLLRPHDALPADQAEQHAQREAVRELAAARALEAIQYDESHPIELARRVRVAQHAMRAAHLDPASEPAAWLSVRYLPAIYQQRGHYKTLACKQRLLMEYQRYIQRFAGRVPEHHRAALDGAFREGYYGAALLEPGHEGPQRILQPPDERCYALYRISVRALAELAFLENTDPRYPRRGNSDDVFAHWLRGRLIPHIPADQLAEEERWWQRFWQEKATRIGIDKTGPWELVEAAFAARAGDAQRVRRCFQALAARYPKADTAIWQLSHRVDAVQLYLRAAGADDWQTWQPRFTAAPRPAGPLTRQAYSAFESALRVKPLPVWDEADLLQLEPAATLMLPPALTDHGTLRRIVPYPRVRVLLNTGEALWLIAPGILDTENQDRPHRIWSIPLAALQGNGELEVAPAEIEWPPHPGLSDGPRATGPVITASHVSHTDTGPIIWLGTRHHGLVRFERRDGQWTGRWFGAAEGLPGGAISWIGSFKRDGQLYPIGMSWLSVTEQREDGSRFGMQQATIWSLDTAAGSCTLHARLPKTQRPGVVVKHADGRRVSLVLYGDSRLDLPPVDATSRFEAVQRGAMQIITLRGDGPLRHFTAPIVDDFAGWASDRLELRELDPSGTATIAALAGSPAHSAQTEALLKGEMHPWLIAFGRPAAPMEEVAAMSTAASYLCLSTRFTPGQSRRGEADRLVFYQPAPLGQADADRMDRWVGPLRSPDATPVFGLLGDETGQVWITTGGGIYRIDAAQLERLPGRSTAQWRQQWQARLADADPAVRLRVHLASGEYDAALALAKAHQSGNTGADAALQPRLDEALVVAETPGQLQRAAELLAEIAEADGTPPAAREYARRQRLRILARLERWQDVLDLLPQLTRFETPYDSLDHDWYARRARQRLKEKPPPATQPGR